MIVLASACAARPGPAPVTAPPPSPPVAVAAPIEVAPAPAPPPVPAIPIPMLAQPGELFMLVVDRSTPSCVRYAIDPKAATLTTTRGAETDAFAYTMHDGKLRLEGPSISINGELVESSGCTEDRPVTASDDGLTVDQSTWFRTAEGCSAAIAAHARVATALTCAVAADKPASPELAKSRARFEKIAQRGGTLYSVRERETGPATCMALRFTPYPKGASQSPIAGYFSFPIDHGTERYDYEMSAGAEKIILLGPSEKYDDGSETALGCGDEVLLEFGADWVSVQSREYFTLARCRAQLAEDKVRASWLPVPPVESSLGARPLTGGC